MQLLEGKTVLIVGLGLIGGSVARGLTAGGHCARVLACGRDESQLQAALLDGSIHAFSTDLSTLVPEADIILIATPTLTVMRMLEQIAPLLGENTIVTDAASVKANVIADARAALGARVSRFIAGHPIAGSEQSGYAASRSDLYQNRKVILTPIPENDPLALRTVMALWQCLGADVRAMNAQRHDQVLAGTSHLPHLLAYTLVNTLVESVGEPDRSQQVFDFAAGGFADFSRIASSDPVMWRDIFLANRDATVAVLDHYMTDLQQMRALLLRADGDALQARFRQAKQVRDDFIRRFRNGQCSVSETASRGSEVLTVGVAVRVFGRCQLSADSESALECLDEILKEGGTWQLENFPDDRHALQRLQALRLGGVPVSGPDNGSLLVFSDVGQDMRQLSLPADPVQVAALAIAATALEGSGVRVIAGEGGAAQLPELLDTLQGIGYNIMLEGRDILIGTAALPDERLALNVPVGSLTDDQCLALVAAGLVGRQVLDIRLDKVFCDRVWQRLQPWVAAGLPIERAADGDTLEVSGLRRDRMTVPNQIDCRGDSVLAMLSVAWLTSTQHAAYINGAGEYRQRFPGLAAIWHRLGVPLAVLSEVVS